MEIDISECTIVRKETILATVLVSDWNIRAWTCLESMRGRITSIYFVNIIHLPTFWISRKMSGDKDKSTSKF